jgi:hypothetical protein
MLWQGQEFGENYYVPEEGWGRVLLFANWPGCAENGRSFAMEITSSTMTTNATRCERCCSTPGNMAMISV